MGTPNPKRKPNRKQAGSLAELFQEWADAARPRDTPAQRRAAALIFFTGAYCAFHAVAAVCESKDYDRACRNLKAIAAELDRELTALKTKE